MFAKTTAANLEKTLKELLGDAPGTVILLKEHGNLKLNRLTIKWAEKNDPEI